MPPKKVTDKALAAELERSVRHIYSTDRDNLTVNYTRQFVEKKLNLKDGFLKEGDWKAKSKEMITAALSEVSNVTGASDSEEPPTKKSKPATPKKKQARKASIKKVKKPPNPSPDEDTSELSEIPEEPQERKYKPTRSILDLEESSKLSDEPQERKSKAKSGPARADESASMEYDDESELSEINDEPPKRQYKSKAESKRASDDVSDSSIEPAARGERKAKSSAKAPAELSPDEAQIKQLQSQLVKCGLRKVWGFELKQYGDDSRAKIKHLKNMLTDVGMTGRFSESRAREIKEQRELLAEIAEVKEGDKSWGVGSRPSRRRAAAKKSFKESTNDEDADAKESGRDKEGGGAASGGDDNDDDSDDDDEAQPKARARASARHRADLAFLGDESDSD
ncbi:hypothetical protein B0T26DRAFT_741643 [Lasiosphaeria miniovina]|uniref:Transcriptional regulator n=1 Tax=Lasiosphaeria miniovina TaxID=1954250 RepID=A0AA40AB16_9PEZI|nr:uncharacterized protein B0T26DRAFT_741643 [Lasiosphaeria miniovina]KAK0712576.1 hypothetical protein B0T26DRAFT_741643 [Lasiosphaeria miniovina]